MLLGVGSAHLASASQEWLLLRTTLTSYGEPILGYCHYISM